MLNQMAFGSYTKRFEKRTPFDWLTRDKEIVDRYIQDPDCGYLFTVQGMHDLITVNTMSNAARWYREVPGGLPILLISGSMDPVGGYGKGVRQVHRDLLATGHENVKIRVYDGARHELFNEINAKDVLRDLLDWLDATRKG